MILEVHVYYVVVVITINKGDYAEFYSFVLIFKD
jgi:hypothetical protein